MLMLASGGSAHEFTTCKNQNEDAMGVSEVTFNPDPPLVGRAVKVTVKGTPTADVEGGELRVDVRVLGITVNTQVLQVCDLVACPLQIGKEFHAEVTQDIPANVPDRTSATVRMTLLNKAKVVQSCLESKVQISTDKNVLSAMAPGDMLQKDVEFLFNKWKAQFPKAVSNFKVFASNLKKIVLHNLKKDKTYTMSMNEFGSMTEDEFAAHYLGAREPEKGSVFASIAPRITYLRPEVSMADPPTSWDWMEKGMVTPVKNQGSCGSCWAFAAVGAMESAYAIKTGKLMEFSEQMLVSCDDTDFGCQGGWMDNAFDWVNKVGKGICTSSDYPYTSGTTSARGECQASSCSVVEGSAPSGFVGIPASEAAILAAVHQHGPVSVGIQADQAAFQFYHSGVLTGTCGTRLNHGVLITGYGVDSATNTLYWKVKNSWGAGWGEEGYVRIQRGKRWPIGGQCGIATHASYPVY